MALILTLTVAGFTSMLISGSPAAVQGDARYDGEAWHAHGRGLIRPRATGRVRPRVRVRFRGAGSVRFRAL